MGGEKGNRQDTDRTGTSRPIGPTDPAFSRNPKPPPLGGGVFTVFFYAARTLWVVTASVILLVLLAETTALYARLARSYLILRREREERMTVMGAMSASIAHELSQPLGAMIANAHAAQLWLSKTPPDLAKTRTSVERI